jgi:hypothetical protein
LSASLLLSIESESPNLADIHSQTRSHVNYSVGGAANEDIQECQNFYQTPYSPPLARISVGLEPHDVLIYGNIYPQPIQDDAHFTQTYHVDHFGAPGRETSYPALMRQPLVAEMTHHALVARNE